MAGSPLLRLEGLRKVYTRGFLRRRPTFTLEADLAIAGSRIVGMLGPNGAGKTTLFEMITGSNRPTAGRVLVAGRDIHRVKYAERDRLAIHYHQSYQVRRFARRVPSFLLQRAGETYPLVHLFDEPQFNTQDGYIGFMLDFFRRLRGENRLVFVCVHPTARYHLEILREICESFLFVTGGGVTAMPDFRALAADERVRRYLGDDMARHADALA
jgi:ABC-type Na+ transport system ATPase subunit NatA